MQTWNKKSIEKNLLAGQGSTDDLDGVKISYVSFAFERQSSAT